MQDPRFSEVVALICKEDGRYDRRAYEFVRLGLDHTVKELRKRDTSRSDVSRHVTGKELANGLKTYALEQFGPMSKTVLNAWGVRECRDFGEIVFNLIDYKVFSKTDNDRREDFEGWYEFEDAFVRPFLPARRRNGTSAAGSVGAA